MLAARGEHGAAAEAFERGADSAEARVTLAASYAALTRFGEAEAILREVTRDPGAPAGAWFNLGLVVWKRGDSAGAYASFERAVIGDPHMTAAMSNLAYLDVEAGRTTAAMAWIERLLAIDPSNADARKLRDDLRSQR